MMYLLLKCTLLSAFLQIGILGIAAQSAQLVNELERANQTKQFSEVERKILKAAIANPGDAANIELFGTLRLYQLRYREATSLFNRALVLDSSRVSARLKLINVLVLTGNENEAREKFAQVKQVALKTDPTKQIYAEIGSVIGKCSDSITVLSQIKDIEGKEEVLRVRVRCALAANEINTVETLIPSINSANNRNVKIAISRTLLENNLPRLALQIGNSLIEKDKADVTAHVIVALGLVKSGKVLRAKESLSKIRALSVDHPEITLIEGYIALANEKPKVAFEKFSEFTKKNPVSKEGLKQTVIAAIRSNQARKGIEPAKKLVGIDGSVPNTYLHGAILLQANQLVEAESVLKGLMLRDPDNSQGCLALGLVLAADLERKQEARKQMLECTRIDPRNHDAFYQLGLSHKKDGDNEKAILYLEKAVELEPLSPAVLRDLGAVYFQSRLNAKARKALEKAVSLDNDDPDVHFQLSRVYSVVGEKALAKKHFDMFRKLKKTPESGM